MTAAHAIAPRLKLDAPGDPGLLRESQKKWIADKSKVKIAWKGRRTGFTFGEAADDVLIAAAARSAGGQNVYYIGTTLDMAREYIDACARWARGFQQAADAISELDVLDDADENGNSRSIKSFEIKFQSGFSILALSSRPRSLRGRQGVVVIDEAAFQDDLEGLIKAAMALIILGGKVRIISTHDGVENFFNVLIEDSLAKRRPFSVHGCPFDQAVEEGLYRSVCAMEGKEWTAEGEAAFCAEVRAFYRPNDAEELDGVPAQSGGTYLPLTLILPCVNAAIPVIRWNFDDAFLDKGEAVRDAEVLARCREELLPLIRKMDPEAATYWGLDFGRSANRTTFWPAQRMRDTRLKTPFLLELYNCPFAQHETIFIWICEQLPRFTHGKPDARGNGAALAEKLRSKFGVARIEEVKATLEWYRVNWPPAKARLEDRSCEVPQDRDVHDDMRAVKVVRGVPVIPEQNAGADKTKGKRHGDAAIAFVNMIAAAAAEAWTSKGYETPKARPRELYEPRARDAGLQMRADDDDVVSAARQRQTI